MMHIDVTICFNCLMGEINIVIMIRSGQRETASLDSVNVQPLLHGVSSSDVYNHRNMVSILVYILF